jgi:hypothetical protein
VFGVAAMSFVQAAAVQSAGAPDPEIWHRIACAGELFCDSLQDLMAERGCDPPALGKFVAV